MHVHRILWVWFFPVLEILLLSKTAKFPFRTMGYSPWSSKNLINWNRLRKFMQVGTYVTCMYIELSGCGLSSFGDTATLKNGQISMGYSPWSSKNLINRNWLRKFMQVGIDVTCMYTEFGGGGFSGFRDTATLKNGQISFSDHGL